MTLWPPKPRKRILENIADDCMVIKIRQKSQESLFGLVGQQRKAWGEWRCACKSWEVFGGNVTVKCMCRTGSLVSKVFK